MSKINSYILSFCKSLSEQLVFYSASIKIYKTLAEKGYKTVFPKFEQDGESISAKNLMDLGLVLKKDNSIDLVANDFNGKNNSYFFISGVNQGGKTTFLKSLGIAQLFAQNGLTIIAECYTGPIFNSFVSHFPSSEDDSFKKGKLWEELSRFYELLPFMRNRALILMNESFATTTEKEGAEIALDVLKALSITRPMLLFVTHNYVLLNTQKELQGLLDNNVNIINLITKQSDDYTKRTYKIVPGVPQEDIHTLDYLTQLLFGD